MPLPRSFFARDADQVARDLIGKHLVHAPAPESRVAVRIVETEAYFGPLGTNPQLAQRDDMPKRLRRALLKHGDPASHSFPGITPRNRVMWGPPAYAYVYLIYGAHECLNVTTGPAGEPQAVLFRAGEAVDGIDIQRQRRPTARRFEDLASGPGKLGAALGIGRTLYGTDMTAAPLFIEEGSSVTKIDVTPRIGVVGAETYRLRFVERGSRFASRTRS